MKLMRKEEWLLRNFTWIHSWICLMEKSSVMELAKHILSAQRKAIEITSDCPYRRTFHSDRGWAYQMPAYSRELKENRIFQSMSRKGNCYDNSVMENFFGL